MADIDRRVHALWPGVNARVVPSDYNSDGMCLRIRVDNDVFVDSTIVDTRWTVIIGADGLSFSIPPESRIFQSYPLSIGAPASQVAPAIVSYMQSAWEGLTSLKSEFIALAEDSVE